MSTAKLMRGTTDRAASTHAASRRAAGRAAALLGLAVASLAFPAATALRAQAPGTVTVGLFGQRTAFDQLTTLRFGTSPGIGGMVGVHVYRGLVVEAATSYTWTSPAAPPRVHASWMPYRARAVYHVPVTENFFPSSEPVSSGTTTPTRSTERIAASLACSASRPTYVIGSPSAARSTWMWWVRRSTKAPT